MDHSGEQGGQEGEAGFDDDGELLELVEVRAKTAAKDEKSHSQSRFQSQSHSQSQTQPQLQPQAQLGEQGWREQERRAVLAMEQHEEPSRDQSRDYSGDGQEEDAHTASGWPVPVSPADTRADTLALASVRELTEQLRSSEEMR